MNETQPDVRYRSVAWLAARWAVTPKVVRDLIHRGELPAYKIGLAYRVRQDDIESYEDGARSTCFPDTAAS